jgi:hypothetical protein
VLVAAVVAGCGDPGAAQGGGVAAVQENLLGRYLFFNNSSGSDCGPEQQFVRQALTKGRAIATTEIFLGCVAEAMAGTISLQADVHVSGGRILGGTSLGPYDPCKGDPYYGDPSPAEWPDVVALARSSLNVVASCNPNLVGYDLAYANVTTNPGPNEQLTFVEPRLAASKSANDGNLVAGEVWHEAMHQHGFVHGNGKAEDCGYSAGQFSDDDTNWMGRHTIPFIVGSCMTYLADISDSCASSPFCGRGKVWVRTGLDPNSQCACVPDPAYSAF